MIETEVTLIKTKVLSHRLCISIAESRFSFLSVTILLQSIILIKTTPNHSWHDLWTSPTLPLSPRLLSQNLLVDFTCKHCPKLVSRPLLMSSIFVSTFLSCLGMPKHANFYLQNNYLGLYCILLASPICFFELLSICYRILLSKFPPPHL